MIHRVDPRLAASAVFNMRWMVQADRDGPEQDDHDEERGLQQLQDRRYDRAQDQIGNKQAHDHRDHAILGAPRAPGRPQIGPVGQFIEVFHDQRTGDTDDTISPACNTAKIPWAVKQAAVTSGRRRLPLMWIGP